MERIIGEGRKRETPASLSAPGVVIAIRVVAARRRPPAERFVRGPKNEKRPQAESSGRANPLDQISTLDDRSCQYVDAFVCMRSTKSPAAFKLGARESLDQVSILRPLGCQARATGFVCSCTRATDRKRHVARLN
jgi:hypothetical protein